MVGDYVTLKILKSVFLGVSRGFPVGLNFQSTLIYIKSHLKNLIYVIFSENTMHVLSKITT